MSDPRKILEQGVAEGLHPGAQLHVVHRGEVVLDFACGEARPGVPMGVASITQWYSSGKPLTATALVQLHERGALDIEGPVAEVLSEFAEKGKGTVTFKHLLTHTAGLRSADKIPSNSSWAEVIQRICETPLEDGWIPGEKAGYSTQASWYILAEAIQRVTRRQFDEYLKVELLDPLEMRDSWLRLPFATYRQYGDRISLTFDTTKGKREPAPFQDAEGMALCRPGASARGPVRELANLYRMMLAGGVWKDRRFLKEETVSWMTARHRTGEFDQTFFHRIDFGLGFIIDSNRYGMATVPYGYGPHCSESTFGHSGAQSSCAFADPENNLVVTWVTNGQPGEREHQVRHRALNTAIYEYIFGRGPGSTAALKP